MNYCVHFIFYNQELLLLKRKKTNPFFPNIWTPVIGKIKNNEQPYDAMIRETKEETGLILANPQFIEEVKHKDDTYWFYQSTTETTDINLNHENDRFSFFKCNELPESLWLLFKNIVTKC